MAAALGGHALLNDHRPTTVKHMPAQGGGHATQKAETNSVPKQTIRDLDLKGKKVLVRVDFNVPQTKDGDVSDDRRIRSALSTLKHALDQGASLILVSHLGRPTGDLAVDAPFKMDKVAARLQELIGKPVKKVDDTVGPLAKAACLSLKPGEIVILENVRFNKGEKKGDEGFAKELASLADCYVNDAFGTCHRDEASMYAVPLVYAPEMRAIGFLVEKEVKILHDLLGNPKRPFTAIMGGAKVSSKFELIENLLPLVDHLLIGGAMTYTFLLAQGRKTGNSLVEPDWVDKAKELMARAGSKLVLAKDVLIADGMSETAKTQVIPTSQDIPDGWEGFDIGPETVKLFGDIIAKSATVVWNGPMGKFEIEAFSKGTRGVADHLTKCKGVTAIGGGETAEAIEKYGLADKVSHVSTGGGAFLESLEGKLFNSLKVIPDKN
jgi:phosphoglycerate kinase